ncbi:MAG: hypothetical protein ACXWNQ_01280 [Anaerolineales bacterium]
MIVIFLLPILTGGLLVHLLWPDHALKYLILKAFLGIGIGLGLTSLSYFLYMSLFAGEHWFVAVQATTLFILVGANVWWERKHAAEAMQQWNFAAPSRLQYVFAGLGGVIFLVSLGSTASYILRRKQGDWDAWMMYNRAARFIYRDQTNWLQSFSRQMDPIFHADYPLFLAMNIASGWDTLGNETPRVPMVQSAIFAVACAGLLVSGLAATRTAGQAALGLIIFWGTPAVVNEGARELADLPLAYFFLATGILIYLYVLFRKPGLLTLAGLTAGLAAWMKNEGSVFVIATAAAVAISLLRQKPWRALLWYAVGLAIPIAFVLYFKFFLAPPSDVLSNGAARSLAQIADPSRHLEIIRYFAGQLLTFGGWTLLAQPIGIIAVLLVYLILVREPLTKERTLMVMVSSAMLGIQMVGYYGVYLITPYDLTWHLSFSVERIFLQIFPLLAFVILSAAQTPETIFRGN